MILNDIWNQYNRLLQSPSTTDIDRKINALNIGQKYLIERMYFLGKMIDEFKSDPTNIANTINLNYVPCPDNFLSLERAWFRAGSQYIPFGKYSFITYDDLIMRTGENFFNPAVNGTPNNFAVKEPNIYFDQHFNNTFTASEIITGATSGAMATIITVDSVTQLTIAVTSGVFDAGEIITGTTSGTTATITTVDSLTQLTVVVTGGTKDIKISYIKQPDDIEYYDTLTVSGTAGVFEVGEVIEGGDSNSTGTIRSVSATEITITNRDGTFIATEELEGSASLATCDFTSSECLPQELTWSKKYNYILCEAGALIWRHMKGSNGVAASSDIVDGLIEMMSVLNRGEEEATWSTN